ncbi:hypothetical protein QTP70_024260 [Hemibagrus guttatus]|uniref:AIG1-type G domain-containing protein n=1 Tax=Hemibagrus guttatus TaxID=175788 RepID=A0AAE0VCS5_9TELE|nr:hypothetical protein QTP70_024260 [Hemibagrus guttatus]
MAGEINLGTNTAMASASSPKAPECRLVLLGKAGAGKNRVARVILGDKTLNEETEECLLHEAEQEGRRIYIVNTPGWDRISIECTTEKIKREIVRSVTLCPPGPHALVLVIPINAEDELSVNELKSASRHMELLSKRVWNHTVVLFLCEGDIDKSTIKERIQKAEKLLEKCGGRHCVMRLSESETQVQGLLKEIDSMVEENADDFFLPQVYYEVMQSKIPQDIRELKKTYEDKIEMLKQGYQNRLNMYKAQTEEETLLKRRRGSMDGIRPSLTEDENQEMDVSAIRKKHQDELLALAKYYFKPVGLLVLAVIGALIGSVVGSHYGVVGSGTGIIIGIIVTIPLALCLITAASLARQKCRLVLLGKAGAGKNRVARVILGDKTLKEETEECLLHEAEQEGRRIYIVNTPGWDRISIECTTEKIKREIVRSVTLCPPGPHALVLVIPINAEDELSVNELKSASRHMELLSKRVWNHTVVLFLCEGDIDKSTIKKHIQKAEKLLEKCGGRHYVMRLSESETQVQGLLEEIDSIVEENPDDCFLPQVYDEVMQSKMSCKEDTQKKTNKQQSEAKVEEKHMLRQRRGSFQGKRPSKCRLVLLGKAGAGKNRVARVILGDKKLNEETEECLLHEAEQGGRRIYIVNTPGWDRISIECTTEKIKREIVRSVTLCPPGPHALVLVIPINAEDELSVNELESASRHMELLSKRVWNHTVVLFLCEGDIDESTFIERIQKAEKLLEKCGGRHCVMRLSESETQVQGLLKEIDSMVEENADDFFLPQVYYEVMQSKIPQDIRELKKTYEDKIEMLKQGYQNRLNMYKAQTEEETLLKRRRGSMDGIRPSSGKMGKRKDLSEFDKGQIVMARPLDQSISKTAALVGCSRSAVVSIYQKWSK